LDVVVGDTPDGLEQADCWDFIRESLHPYLRLAAVNTGASRH